MLSVVCPCFNHANYVGEMIRSCLEQDYANWELVLVDDASTDESLEVMRRYAANDDRIRVLSNPANRGAIVSANRGLVASRGRFVAMRSADDLDLPGFFSAVARAIQQWPHAKLVCGDLAYFRTTLDRITREPLLDDTEATFVSPTPFATRCGDTPIHGHTAFLERSHFASLGFFDENHRWYNDWFPVMRTAFEHGFVYLAMPVVACRLVSVSFGNTGNRSGEPQIDAVASVLRSVANCSTPLLERFCSSGCLGFFGAVARTALARLRPEEQAALGLSLVSHQPLSVNGMNAVIRSRLKDCSRAIHQRLHRGARLLVFGAGKHTDLLLQSLHELGFPQPAAILDSAITTPQSTQDSIPLCHPDGFTPATSDILLISSKSYEQEMIATARARWPELPLLAFWDATVNDLANATDPTSPRIVSVSDSSDR